MAIIIEEEKNKVSLLQIAVWVGVLVIVIVAAYYIFFSPPPLIEVTAPPAFKNIAPLASVNTNPDEIANILDKTLKSYVTVPVPGNTGRANPFLPL